MTLDEAKAVLTEFVREPCAPFALDRAIVIVLAALPKRKARKRKPAPERTDLVPLTNAQRAQDVRDIPW